MIVEGWRNERGVQKKRYENNGSIVIARIQGIFKALGKADQTILN